MRFLSPLSLVWFIPLGGVVVALYLLKLRRREHTVASVMLWQDAVADIQANAPFQKLKKSLLLLLQLIALLALALGLARPYIRASGASENKIVMILDCSASMQSTDVAPSRFEDAKSKAIGVVKRMGSGDTMLVITAGAKTRVVASFTSDKLALSSAISALKAVDTTCNMRQAVALAFSLIGGKSASAPRVVVLSDGGFGDLPELSAKNAQVDYIKIGSRCDNVGIAGIDSRKTLSGRQEVFVGLRNFGTRERRFNLEIYARDQLVDIREESLKGGESRQEILSNIDNLSGRVMARLDISDDLAADNSGWVYLAGQSGISVLLVSKGNVFLQNALGLDPRIQLTRADAVPPDLQKGKFDIVVFDCVDPPKSLPPGGYLLVNCGAEEGPADAGGRVNRPAVIDSSKNHPVSSCVDFTDTRIAQASILKPKPWASALVEAEGGALAVAGGERGRRFVQLGFNLLDSDFPLHVGFPIFIANCLDYLAPPTTDGQSLRTGQVAYLDVPPGAAEVTITCPDGTREQVAVTGSPLAFDDTDQAGVYKVTGKGARGEFACNLTSSQESDTMPRGAMTVGGRRFSSGGKQVETNREFYVLALLAALSVLVFEWYAYHRRL